MITLIQGLDIYLGWQFRCFRWFPKLDPDVNLKHLQIINLLKSIYNKYSIRRHRSRNSRAKGNSDIFSLLFILVSTYKLARSQFSLSTSVNRI